MNTDNSNLYSKEGYELVGMAMNVYNEMGGGLLEEIYQQCLEIELSVNSVPFDSKKQLSIFYKDRKLDKLYIPDIFAYDGIILELKSVAKILPEHEAQLLNYMRISKTHVGYIVNFGNTEKLDWKRYVISVFRNISDNK